MRARGARTELAGVAVALLLPIPLFVAGGLRLPLPDAVERGLAALGSDAVFGSADVEATPEGAQPEATVSGSADASTPASGRRATSSTALVVAQRGASSVDNGGRTPVGGSTPDTGDQPLPPTAAPEHAPSPEAPAPPGNTPIPPVDVEATTTVETGAADPVEINVNDERIEVVVAGESVEVTVPDVPVQVPAPPVPLPPLPPLPLTLP